MDINAIGKYNIIRPTLVPPVFQVLINPLTAGPSNDLYSRSNKLSYLANCTLYYLETMHKIGPYGPSNPCG